MKNMNFPWAGELHRMAGRQAAQQDRPVGCTLSWPIENGGPEGRLFSQSAPPFSATRRTAFLCSPPDLPSVFSAARQSAESSCFSFGNTALQLARPSRPAGPPISVIHVRATFGHDFLLQLFATPYTTVLPLFINKFSLQ